VLKKTEFRIQESGVRIRQQASLAPIRDFKPQIAPYTESGKGATRSGVDFSHWVSTCLLNSEF
jgi:hypothetical protein